MSELGDPRGITAGITPVSLLGITPALAPWWEQKVLKVVNILLLGGEIGV